jgi:hypothetical protein
VSPTGKVVPELDNTPWGVPKILTLALLRSLPVLSIFSFICLVATKMLPAQRSSSQQSNLSLRLNTLCPDLFLKGAIRNQRLRNRCLKEASGQEYSGGMVVLLAQLST